MSLMMANQGGNNDNNVVLREYRKGNWTVQETMVLIEAKKMDEERRMKRIQGESSSNEGVRNLNKPAELRWKWVEDYCWRNGCLRSQNQCNDKWDNLMRDFKKVRDYERRMGDNKGDNLEFGGQQFSYWKMDKIMRKEKHLPSNLLPQIYEALVDVVEKKGQRFFASGCGGTSSTTPNIVSTNVLGQRPIGCSTIVQPVVSLLPHLQHHISSLALPLPPLPPLPQPSPPSPPLPESYPCPQPLTIVGTFFSDSQTSGQSNSSAKRRRRGEETSNAAASNANHEVGSAISRSASLIAGAIQAKEEREERRHRELLNLHEKRLQIEESKAEINRQGITGMVDAINKLAHSVLALAANKKPPNS